MEEEMEKEVVVVSDDDKMMIPSLNVLSASSMITSEDIGFLKEHAPQFEKRFRTRSLFRSETEMRAGVLNEDEHPTPDSKYWQAIGEQNVHLTELISLDFEAKKLEADSELLAAEIEELEYDLENGENTEFEAKKLIAKIKRKKVEYNQNKFNLTQQMKTAQERMREVKTWEPIIEALVPQLEFGTEDFGLHHAKRYHLRYLRRVQRLEAIDPASRENVISHHLSFSKHLNENPALAGPQAQGQLPDSKRQDADYGDKESLLANDEIAAGYFDRPVRKILVSTPHRNNGDPNATDFFMMQTPAAFTCELEEPYGYTVAGARNFVIQKAIDQGYDYVFFVDDDVLIPRNALVQLIHHNADIVGGMYYRKYFPLETVGMHLDEEGFPCSVKYTMGDVIHNTLVLPSGCTLIKVEVLKKLEAPWYKTITVKGRPTLTEDTYLCQRLRDIGVDIITDTGIQCLHIDYSKGIIYGHPDIVDQKQNRVRPEWVEYFARGNN